MDTVKKLWCAALLSVALSVPVAACAQTLKVSPAIEVQAGSASLPIHVGGRVQRRGGAYLSQWPGAYFEAAFSGREVFFRTGEGDVHLRVTVDGQAVSVLRPGHGLHRIGGLADGDHRLRIEIVSENQTAPVNFEGVFGVPARATVVGPRARQIEFIGDSHTVGYANTTSVRDCSDEAVWETTDTGAGIAGVLARRYDADYQVNAISGRGVVRNYGGMARDTLPQAYPFTLFDKQVWYADAAWRPQVIVVALGTNDFSTELTSDERWKSREALTNDYEIAYAAFLRGLRLRSPDARIVAWGGEGSEMAAASQRVVTRLRAEGDARIVFAPVAGMGLNACHWHPDLADDRAVAATVAAVLDGDADLWADR
jgi:lysophospholipase L1-like esterase